MLERLITQVGEHPKLELWQPPLCGDIDIRIDREGQWHCQGTPFNRDRMVRLFASVLRREQDGDYYLVTPVEKWRLQVDDLPFVLTQLHSDDHGSTLSGPLGIECKVNSDHPWQLIDGIPAVRLWHGNWARLSRPLYYQLADKALSRGNELGIELAGQWCVLGLQDAC
ncbi:DUF1285 domain-containing protein [Ferrimonas lipolytica]|uniref:DUF1285 domain-containing protein n=1 Tax=Ferrimonas lipolytica TaxID=2724191 RepID=A0A6H1UDW0_9GAMM|nr:DUF1285 domain-containing protein [Ferrimonas lipolytica]QIZ76406.1 DUF1285 domain-containing protein [Ferrimonas lipolytica]